MEKIINNDEPLEKKVFINELKTFEKEAIPQIFEIGENYSPIIFTWSLAIIIKHLNAEMNNEDLTHMIAEFLETDTINTVT